MLNLTEMFQVVERDDDRIGFVVHPGVLYPDTIAHVREIVQAQREPTHSALKQLYDEALLLPADVWSWALVDRDAVEAAHVADRAAALEIARRWATELLHQTVGGVPMAIRILADPRYRL